MVEQGKKTVTVVEVERKITLKPSNLKTKKLLQDALQCRGLPHQGTIPELRERLQTSLAQLREDYEKSGKVSTAVNMDKVTADSMASNSDSCLYLVELTLDSVGITGAVKEFSRYPSNCKSVYVMFISNRTLVISYDKGIAKIDMATREQTVLLSTALPLVKKYEALLLSGIRQIKKVSSNGTVQIIAGSGEEGNNDGSRASFSQPIGICVENGKNIFITDAQVGAVKLITDVGCAVKFWKTLQNCTKLSPCTRGTSELTPQHCKKLER